MKTKIKIVSMSAVVCAAALTCTSTIQAGTLAGFHRLDTGISRVSPGRGGNNAGPALAPNNSTGSRANRHGADDPANHDINDDRGGNQPGDDRGRNRGRELVS